MIDDYSEIKNAIEEAGFFTTFMPIVAPGDRMVCASRRHPGDERAGPLGGISFWVAKRGDDWFVATWSGLPYRVPDQERLVALCLELLRRENRGALNDSDLDQRTRMQFALEPIDPDDFHRLKPR